MDERFVTTTSSTRSGVFKKNQLEDGSLSETPVEDKELEIHIDETVDTDTKSTDKESQKRKRTDRDGETNRLTKQIKNDRMKDITITIADEVGSNDNDNERTDTN